MKYLAYLVFFSLIIIKTTTLSAQTESFSLPEWAYDVSQDLKTLFVADLFENRVRAISFTSKKDIAHLKHQSIPYAVFVDDADSLVITVDERKIKIWDAYSFELKESIAWNDYLSGLSSWRFDYNPNSNTLLITDNYFNLYLININDSKVINRKLDDLKSIAKLEISNNGLYIYGISRSGDIFKWDINNEGKFKKIASTNKITLAFTCGIEHLFVLTIENPYDRKNASIYKYDLKGKLISKNKIDDFNCLTTGNGVYNKLSIDWFPSLMVYNDDAVFIETYDGIFYIDFPSNYRRKILKGFYQSSYSMPKSFKLKSGQIIMNVDRNIYKIDSWGQIKDKILLTNYNDGLLGFEKDQYKLFLNTRNNLFQIDSTGSIVEDSISNKPTGIFLQNDNNIIFSTTNNTVETWDLSTFTQEYEINLNKSSFPVDMCSNKNNLFMAYPYSGIIEMYDIKSGELQNKITVTDKHISCIINDEDTIIAGTTDGYLIKYSLNDKKIINEESYLFDGISTLKKNEDYLIAAGKGRFLIIPEHDSLFYLVGHEQYINSLDLTYYDDRTFAVTATTGDSIIKIWDIDNKVLIKNIFFDDISNITNAIFVEDLSTFSSGSTGFEYTDNTKLAQSIRGQKITTKFQTSNSGQENQIKFSPGEKYILMIGTNNVKIWDVLSSQLLSNIKIQMDFINDAEIIGDERTLIVTNAISLQYYDIFTGELKKSIDLAKAGIISMHMLRYVPNSTYILGINAHGWHMPFLFHTNSGTLYGALPIGAYNKVYDIQFSPDGKLMAVYSNESVRVMKWNTELFRGNGEVILEIPYTMGDRIFYANSKISFSKDSKYIAAMFFENEAPVTEVYNLESKQLLSTFSEGVACFGYNDMLIQSSASKPYTIDFIDINQKKSIKTLTSKSKHISLINSILYSHKYNRFVSIDTWGNYKFWDGITGAVIAESNRFENDFYSALPTKDGRKIFYNHKKGVFYIDLDNLKTTQIENANNYPVNIVFNNETADLYYVSRKSTKSKTIIESYNIITTEIDSIVNLSTNYQEIGSMQLSADEQYLGFKYDDNDQTKIMIYDLWNNSSREIALEENEGFIGFDILNNNSLILSETSVKDSKKDIKYYFTRKLFYYNIITEKKSEILFEYSFSAIKDFLENNLKIIGALSEKKSPNGKYITTISESKFNVMKITDKELIYSNWNEDDIASVKFDELEEKLFILYKNGNLNYVDLEEKKEIVIDNIGLSGKIKQLNSEWLLIFGDTDELLIFDWKKKQKISSLFVHDGKDFAIIADDNNYYSTAGAIKNISFRTLTNVYSFEQFDLFYNRPHEVLSTINSANHELQEAYKKAWEKRNSISGLQSLDFSSIVVPKLKIDKSNIPINSLSDKLNLSIDLSENKNKIIQLNVWVNNVSIYGQNGLRIHENGNPEIEILLNEDINKIELSCVNENGIESFKETIEINYKPEIITKPNLYFIAISTSKYQQSEFNLQYAVKDGRDLAQQFSKSIDQYNHVFIDTLFNKNATLESVTKLKEKLLKTNVDDQVILFISGHGLLDDKLDFYFATYDMDFNNPAKNGISYDLLESLLDSIPARKKLFMMDACHSGEVDKEELIALNETKKENGLKSGVKSYTYRANVLQEDETKSLGLQNSFELMQELFTNLNRGSGAMVISAAAGDSYAMESDVWNNGVFTYSVLNGLKTNQADLNNDKQISVSELREYVIDNVQNLTGGKQKPTSRQENVEFDFRVW